MDVHAVMRLALLSEQLSGKTAELLEDGDLKDSPEVIAVLLTERTANQVGENNERMAQGLPSDLSLLDALRQGPDGVAGRGEGLRRELPKRFAAVTGEVAHAPTAANLLAEHGGARRAAEGIGEFLGSIRPGGGHFESFRMAEKIEQLHSRQVGQRRGLGPVAVEPRLALRIAKRLGELALLLNDRIEGALRTPRKMQNHARKCFSRERTLPGLPRNAHYNRKMLRLLPLLLAAATLLSAQNIGIGFKGGVPLKDAYRFTRQGITTKRDGDFVIGPLFEVRLPAGLGIELNALYRQGAGSRTWELPLLVKYRFPGVLVRPVLGGGYTFQRLSDLPGLNNRKGVAASGGVEFKLPRLRITPELRYTRFNEQRPSSGLLTGTNQVDALVGFSF